MMSAQNLSLLLLVVGASLGVAMTGFYAGLQVAPWLERRLRERAARRLDTLEKLILQQLAAARDTCALMAHVPVPTAEKAASWQTLSHAITALQESWDRIKPTLPVPTPEIPDKNVPLVWEMSSTDRETGLPDQHVFDRSLTQMIASRSAGTVGGVLLVRFQKFADLKSRHGDAAAKALFQKVVSVLLRQGRDTDLICRLQPDLLGLLLPDRQPARVLALAEAFREAVRDHRFHLPEGGAEVLVSASFGMALAKAGDPATLLMDRAGTALARAQSRGRNQLNLDEACTEALNVPA